MCLGSSFIDCRCTAPQSFPNCQIYYFYWNSSIFLFLLQPRRPFAKLQHTPWLRMRAPHVPSLCLFLPQHPHILRKLWSYIFSLFSNDSSHSPFDVWLFFQLCKQKFSHRIHTVSALFCSLVAASPYLLLCLYLERFLGVLHAII